MSAVITLYTGQPGNGKTLRVVQQLEELQKAGRLLYVHGIKELQIPHQVLDDPEKWYEVPEGAIVVIDEAQKIFPPRGSSQKAGLKVTEFETLRHRGLEAILITQNPALIDIEIRKLVGKHFHIERLFGSHYATIYEWPRCGTPENQRDRKQAQKDLWKFPARVYSLYKSAEIHTIQRQIPKVAKQFAFYFVFALLIIPAVLYYLYSGNGPDLGAVDKPTGNRVESAAPVASVSALATTQAQDYAMARIPRIDGLPQTAPAYDELTRPKRYPRPAACIAATDRCTCYSQDGTRLPIVPTSVCRSIVADGYFDDAQPERPTAVATAAPSAQPTSSTLAAAPAVVASAAPTASVATTARNPALWW